MAQQYIIEANLTNNVILVGPAINVKIRVHFSLSAMGGGITQEGELYLMVQQRLTEEQTWWGS